MMTADRFVHYKLGHTKIDEQHWMLFVQMNTIIDELTLGDNESAVDHIAELVKDLHHHIAAEEKYMMELRYPVAGYHREQHHIMVNAITALSNSIEMNQLVSKYSIDSLSEILVYHVDHSDRQFISWVDKNASQEFSI